MGGLRGGCICLGRSFEDGIGFEEFPRDAFVDWRIPFAVDRRFQRESFDQRIWNQAESLTVLSLAERANYSM